MREREAEPPERTALESSHTQSTTPESMLRHSDGHVRALALEGISSTTEATESAAISPTSRAPNGALPGDIVMLEPGRSLGIYRLTRRVDSGNMGVVYEAINTERALRVALKTLLRFEPRGLFRLKQEFRQIADVSHPNLVHLHELVGWQGTWFFTMDFVDGVDFQSHLRGATEHSDQPHLQAMPAVDRLREAMVQLIHGLQALHDAGIVHCDVKPSNVLVEETGRVVVLDFGIARTLRTAFPAVPASTSHENQRRFIAGTPAYLAPEQALGHEPEPASDWYAVGVMLFQALTGMLPFTDSPHHVITAKIRYDPPHPTSVCSEMPADLYDIADLCWRMLARDPRDRPRAEGILTYFGEHLQGSARPLRVPSATLIGRDTEITALRRAYEIAAGGTPVCAFVKGSPGIGKSALVQHALRSLAETARIFAGRCYEREAVPFKVFDPLVDELRDHLDALLLSEQLALLSPALHETATMFPVLSTFAALDRSGGTRLPEEAAPERRRQAFLGLKHLFAALRRTGPVILFIDDIQWGDRDSVALLIELLSPPDAPSLLIVASGRDDDVRASAFLDEWRRQTQHPPPFHVESIHVNPLERDDTITLIRTIWPEVEKTQADALIRETGGSPFLVEELVHHARTRVPDKDPPIGIADVVAARVDGLSESTRNLLYTIAIAGRPIPQIHALQACGVEERALFHLSVLRAQSLIRTFGSRSRDSIEMYHDRIRESIVARLAPMDSRRIHGHLARTLDGHAPPDVLAHHFHGAGDPRRAAELSVQAAEQARDTLAFERAAALYAQALEWGDFAPAVARNLAIQRARALANAGHNAQAAPLFLQQAAHGHPDHGDLRRRAAEAYFVAGHIDEGLRVIMPLLHAHGIEYPRSSWRLARNLLLQLGRLAMSGTTLERRSSASASVDMRARGEFCWSLSKGLSVVMPLQGMNFALRSLHYALATGDAVRAGQALACLGANLVVLSSNLANKYLEQARELDQKHGDPYLRGTVWAWQSVVEVFHGNWSGAVHAGSRSLDAMRDRCVGTAWEENVALGAQIIGLIWMGRLGEAAELALLGIRTAERRGDLYGQVMFMQNAAYCHIARGEIDRARQRARWTYTRWTHRQHTIQHAYAMRIEALCDLYQGRPRDAAARFLEEFARGPLWYRKVMRAFVDFALLEAKIRLSLPVGDPICRKLTSIEQLARRLERGPRRDGAVHARLLRASELARTGDEIRAAVLMDRCIAEFDGLDMRLDAVCTRFNKARLLGDVSLAANARADVEQYGVPEPERWLLVMAPGLTTTP